MQEIKFTRDLRIVNIESLRGGLRCKFLLTIKGEGETLIAKQWKRRRPVQIGPNEVLVTF